MAYENLIVEHDAETGVLVITLNRPKVLNALNAATLGELRQAIEAAAIDAAVRAIVLISPRVSTGHKCCTCTVTPVSC